MAETLVDPSKCTVDGPGVQNAEVSTLAHFSINIPHTSGNPEPELEIRAELKSLVDDSTVQVQVIERGSGIYDGTYVPTMRGHHHLSVEVNGEPIIGSPYPVFVTIPLTRLRNPVRIMNEVELPQYITINNKQQIVVSEAYKGLAVLDKKGTRVLEVEMKKKDGSPRDPMGVAVDEEDNMYVVEREEGCISKYDRNGKHLRSSVARELKWPWGLQLIDAELYVCEHDDHQIMIFDKEQLVQSSTQLRFFNHPRDLTTDEKGTLYVADVGINRIHVLADGKVIRVIHGVPSPSGVCYDHKRQVLYVAEQLNCRVSVFTPNGDHLYSFGKKGTKEGELNSPMGLAVDGDGYVYVCDSGNGRIQVF